MLQRRIVLQGHSFHLVFANRNYATKPTIRPQRKSRLSVPASMAALQAIPLGRSTLFEI